MSKKMHISDDLKLPLDAVTQTLLVLGGKGMGKTNFLSVLAEELSAASQRFSVLDPMGVCWGLQHAASGKGPGIEVLILGGRHGDIPIEPTAGAVVADLVADEEVNVVIDISRRANGTMWSKGERIRFVTDYCIRLYERQGERRRPLMQIIDEAGRFIPQVIPHGAQEIAKCVGAIESLVEEGRNIGAGVCLVTQRSARINKSVSELAECMVAFRTVGPRSVDAILDWFGEHVPKDRWKELVEKLRSLPRGQALVVSPGWLEFEGVARIRARQTFDSSATPTGGGERQTSGKAAKPDLAKYRQRMEATIERAKAEDPRELRRRIAQLEAELRTKGKGQTAAQAAGGADFIHKAKAQSLVLRAQQEAQAAFHGQRQRTAGALRKLLRGLSSAAETLAAAERQLGELAAGFASETGPHIEAVRPSSSLAQGRPQAKVPRTALPVVPSAEENNGQLTGPERRILNAIAWFNTLGIQAPKQVAVSFLAGYTYGGGAFYNPRGTLRRKGLVEYLGGEAICLTGEGRTWAGHTDQPLTTEELHSRVMAVLPGPETKILEVAIAAYPGAISKEECAERSGYTPDGGAFNNPCGRLRSMGLIDYPSPGLLRAEDLLFLDA